MSFAFVVTIDGIFQLRGGLTQATAFLIGRYGTLDDGINAGARILPEWLPVQEELAAHTADPSMPYGLTTY